MTTRARRIEIGLLVLLLAAPLCGAAEERDGEKEPAEPPEGGVEFIEVNVSSLPSANTIATKLPAPLHLTPANVGAVSGALLREQDALVLGDALRNVSGVNVQSGTGIYDQFYLRGFDSLTSGLVMTDGAVEPEVTFYNLYNAEGVEVLKGPAGFLYGSRPLAGAVNVVRKQPVPTDFAEIAGSFGSHGTAEGTLDWNRSYAEGTRNFRLNGLWYDTHGYRDRTEGRSWAVNPSFTWQIDGDTTLNLNLEFVDAEFAPDAGLPLYEGAIPAVPRERSYQSPFDFSEQQVERLQVDYETRLSDALSLRSKTYYRGLDWETRGTIFLGAQDLGFGDPLVFRTLTTLDDRQRVYGTQFEALWRFSTGRVTHELLTGIEVARHTDDFAIEYGDLDPIGLGNPIETTTSVATVPLLAGDQRDRILAPYVVDQMRLSERVRLLLGARYDWIDVDGEKVDAFLGGVPAAVRRDDDDLSPLAGVVFSPNADLSIYVNAGESFAPASARVTDPPNPVPEQSRQVELGVKQRFLDGRVRVAGALYRIDRENIAIPDFTGVTQQVGDQESRGLEIEVAAEPRKRLHALFSYAYNDSELGQFAQRVQTGPGPTDFVVVDRSGNVPAFAPQHLASAWVRRSFESGFGVGGGVRYVGEQYIAEDNAFEIDAAVVLDAMAYYDFEGCRVTLRVRNLTDEEYETRGFGGASVTPATERSVQAGFELRF